MNLSISKIKSLLISITGILVMLIFWNLLAAGFSPLILPSPAETWQALLKLHASGQLWNNLLITVKRTLLGYVLAWLLGIGMALFLKLSSWSRYFFRPLITIIQVTPPIIWLVLAVVWFGIAEDLTPIFLIFVVTFPIVFVNLFTGLENIDHKLLEMAKVYCFKPYQVFRHIYLPSLLPHLLAAVNVGLAFAWKSTVFAEFFGSSSGIGFALSRANNNLETAELFAWAFVLILLMLTFEYLLFTPLEKYLTRWKANGN